MSVPKVADDPTCQNTLQASAPFTRAIVAELAPVRVDPAWKIKTAFGSFSASRVKVPVTASELADL